MRTRQRRLELQRLSGARAHREASPIRTQVQVQHVPPGLDPVEGGAHLLRPGPQHVEDGRSAFGRRQGHARLDDAGLLARDLHEGVAEVLLVIQRHIGDRAHLGSHDVGGVEPPAETDLDARCVDLLLGEHHQGEKCGGLEERHPEPGGQRAKPPRDLDQSLGGHRLAIDHDPFAKGAEVRRGVESRALASVPQDRGPGRRDRALPVGPSDVKATVATVRIAQFGQRRRHAPKPPVDGGRRVGKESVHQRIGPGRTLLRSPDSLA